MSSRIDDQTMQATIKQRLGELGFTARFLAYADLATMNLSTVRGKSVVVISPVNALNEPRARGLIDDGLVRMMSTYLWKQLVAVWVTDAESHMEAVSTLNQLSQRVSHDIAGGPSSRTWLEELLLTLLYKRHTSLRGLTRLVENSTWWHTEYGSVGLVKEALLHLRRTGLVSEKRGSYTVSGCGRLLVERGLAFDQANLAEIRREYEAEHASDTPARVEDGLERERSNFFEELVFDLITRNGWVSVNEVAQEATRTNITKRPSLGKSRRFLERLVAKGKLGKSVYRRGMGRPSLVYFEPNSDRAADLFGNRCGDCALYSRVTRRCRLWWALSRYNASQVYAREELLSPVARDKLRRANARMGPNATACDAFAPKKRDYPLVAARSTCLSCGKEIEPPVAKTVRCPNCATAYKPLSHKILVLYNYALQLRTGFQGSLRQVRRGSTARQSPRSPGGTAPRAEGLA